MNTASLTNVNPCLLQVCLTERIRARTDEGVGSGELEQLEATYSVRQQELQDLRSAHARLQKVRGSSVS